jgi:hypothetical protein
VREYPARFFVVFPFALTVCGSQNGLLAHE